MNLAQHTSRSNHQHHGRVPDALAQILPRSPNVPLIWHTYEEWWWPETQFDFGNRTHFGALHGIETLVTGSATSLDELSQKGCSPLFFASMHGHSRIAEMLLQYEETHINRVDKHGCAPIHMAILMATVWLLNIFYDIEI